jgi:peptidoglycan/LPS O-acetylase OafA/YrhL
MSLIKKARSIGLDFLRGIAVILVLFRHHSLFTFTKKMGWIGVDLFFVLSGFLISGLLFVEYLRYGNIKPGLFLIRRGFKIYPVFYLFILLTCCVLFLSNRPVPSTPLLGELLFIQNYVGGLWTHTWSLAVEEHFYFIIALSIPLLVKSSLLGKGNFMVRLFGLLFALALALRFASNAWGEPGQSNFFQTHLRFDSLLAGVFISYLYYFRRETLQKFFNRFRPYLLPVVFLLLLFTPWVDPLNSFFVKTVGFTLTLTGFGFLLVYFLFLPDIEIKLNNIFSKYVVGTIRTIGFYSYTIYLFHMSVAIYLMPIVRETFRFSTPINFSIYWLASILFGIGMSKLVELPMLKMRDHYFPSRPVTISNPPLEHNAPLGSDLIKPDPEHLAPSPDDGT